MVSAQLFIIYLDKCLQRVRLTNVVIQMDDLVFNCQFYEDDAVLVASTSSKTYHKKIIKITKSFLPIVAQLYVFYNKIINLSLLN